VRLLGAVDAPWEVLAASDIAAVPTLWPDPLPRAVLEAMAAGRPVVASDTGGIPEMIEDGVHGALTPPGDVDAVAVAVGRLVDDPELRRRLGTAARERVGARFGLDRHVDRMEAVLLRAAGQ
jgi:glycosyltransferase involved in cell wall biosynthesis